MISAVDGAVNTKKRRRTAEIIFPKILLFHSHVVGLTAEEGIVGKKATVYD